MPKRWLAALLALLILSPGVSHAGRSLKFVKRIGEGWSLDAGPAWMSFVAFGSDGKTVAADAASSPNDTSGDLTLWSFPQGHLIRRLPIRPTAVSPDLRYFATSRGVGEINSARLLISLPAATYAFHAFSPDGAYVAQAGPGGGVKIFSLPAGREVSAFGRLQPSSITMSPDGTTLASGHWNIVKLWNWRTGKRLAVLHGFRRYVDGLSFTKDGKLLVTSGGGEVQIWRLRHQKRLRTVKVDAGDATPVFSPDGRLIAIGSYGSGAVWLIDARRGRVIDHQKVSDLGCGSAAFSPDGRYLITPSTGGLITWPYDRGGTIRVFQVNKR
jgi:hypothetical protein